MLETLERLILDPISENPPYQVAANRPVEITGNRTPSPEGHGIFLSDHSYPRPEMQSTFASSRDSQGEPRFGKSKFGNRKIPIKVLITEASGVGEATNLVTNPSFETNLTGWTSGTATGDFGVTTALSRLASWFKAGEYSAYIKLTKAATATASTWKLTTAENILGIPVAAGTEYAASAWVNVLDAPATGVRVEIRWWTAGGALLSTTEGQNVNTLGESKLSVVGKAPATAAFAAVRIIAASSTSGDVAEFQFDAVQFEQAVDSKPTPYLDGDVPGCYWTGTAHGSTAKRIGTGSNRRRFIRSLYDLEEKIEKLAEEGGTYKRVLPDGSWMVFDVIEASFVGEWAKQFNQGQQEFSFELICKPGARLQPISLAAREEKTLPILKFVEADIPGNMPALGDLLIEDLQGVDRQFVAVSVASRFLDQSANADVFYEAESRMRLSGASLAVGSGERSGSETNKVVNCPLFEEFTPYLSTRSSGGAYTSHVGAQKIFARIWRPTANTGEVSLRFEYSQGDLLRWKPLETVTFQANTLEGAWMLVDLGVVRLNRAAVGTQRWEGRLTAKSTVAGDVVQVDWIGVMPVEEFYGEAQALTVQGTNVGTMFARDNFSQSSGALTGKSATVGGAWSFLGGDTDDFQVGVAGYEGKARRQPAAVDVAGSADDPPMSWSSVTGRYMRLGTGVLAGVSASLDVFAPSVSDTLERRSILTRIVDINNLVMTRLARDVYSNGVLSYKFDTYRKVAGVWKFVSSASATMLTPGSLYTIGVTILPDGSGSMYIMSGSTVVSSSSWKAIADLATGGVLDDGGYGIAHGVAENSQANYPGTGVPSGATFDNFSVREASALPQDAAMYANRDLRVRWDKTLREASDGSGTFSEVGAYEGDRLLIPHSGREARPIRVAILASRGLPGVDEDPQADDTRATLTITPRVTEVPEPVA